MTGQKETRGKLLIPQIETKYIILFYPLLIIVGKIVRWTLMRNTLIGYSQGWGYVDPIMYGGWSWQFFGVEEISEGNIGQGENVFSFFRVLWYLWAKAPNTFQSFEVCITITYGILLFLVLANMKRKINAWQASFVVLAVIVNSVYCFCLSKEPFQMIYFFLMYFFFRTRLVPDRYKLSAGYIAVLLSAMTFRTYYTLIIVMSLGFEIGLRLIGRVHTQSVRAEHKTRPLSWRVIVELYGLLTVMYLCMMIVLFVAKPSLFVRFRDSLLTASAASSSSNTYIKNWIADSGTSNVFLIWLEYAVVVLRMMFPFELIARGPKYWLYVLYQLQITVFLLTALRNIRSNTATQNAALSIMIGFVFSSAMFEVDYGAWTRHCAVTLPIILLMSGINRPKKAA